MVRGKVPKRLVIAGAAALAAPALIAASQFAWLVILDPFGGGSHPTDEAMLAQFQGERKILEELVRMVDENPKLLRVAPDFTRPEDFGSADVSPDRLAIYRRLFREAGVAHSFSITARQSSSSCTRVGWRSAGAARGSLMPRMQTLTRR